MSNSCKQKCAETLDECVGYHPGQLNEGKTARGVVSDEFVYIMTSCERGNYCWWMEDHHDQDVLEDRGDYWRSTRLKEHAIRYEQTLIYSWKGF